MKNLTKLFISFWLYFPLNLQAAEHNSMSPPAENSQTYQQVQEMPFKNFLSREDDYIYSDDYMHRLNNRTFGKDTPFEPYKSPFNRENFFHMATTVGGLGVGEIVFEFGIKELFKTGHGSYHLVPLMITSNILFDLLSATSGFYAYKKWFKPNFEDKDSDQD